MKKILNLSYSSSLSNLCEVNSSFDSGILRVAYIGKNRNGSYISKDVFEKCLKTIYNCPLVCHYDRETDTIGGHDIDVVTDDCGNLKIVNLTTPIGCVPESAKTFWEEVEEEDGTTHEYLCTEVLLWKRQEAYQKIKKDGCESQSMEITVLDGEVVDGSYHIYDFEFTAFALIGVEPCFESAALEFSKLDFKHQLQEMMSEIKSNFSNIDSLSKDGDKNSINLMKGGNHTVKKTDILAKYGFKESDLDFSIEELSVEDLESKLKSFAESSHENEPASDDNAENTNNFALESNFREELQRVVSNETVQTEWGEAPRYWFVDYDKELNEVFCWDTLDWLLYGFGYSVDGDAVTVDYDSKKRKKFEIVDFDEGEQSSPIAQIFSAIREKFDEHKEMIAEYQHKYQEAEATLSSMSEEVSSLKQFKKDIEDANLKKQKEDILSQFAELDGIEEFENLKSNVDNMEIGSIEEKCFAIKGKNIQFKFSTEPSKTIKLKIDKSEESNEPYGGIFRKYGIKS